MQFYMNNDEMDPASKINQPPNKQIEICRYCSRDLPDGFICACNVNYDDDAKSEISAGTDEINRYLYCYTKVKQQQLKFIWCHCCAFQQKINAIKCTQCGNSLMFNKANQRQLIPIDSAWRTDQSVDRGLRYNPNGLTSTCMYTYTYFVGNISISIYTICYIYFYRGSPSESWHNNLSNGSYHKKTNTKPIQL